MSCESYHCLVWRGVPSLSLSCTFINSTAFLLLCQWNTTFLSSNKCCLTPVEQSKCENQWMEQPQWEKINNCIGPRVQQGRWRGAGGREREKSLPNVLRFPWKLFLFRWDRYDFPLALFSFKHIKCGFPSRSLGIKSTYSSFEKVFTPLTLLQTK